VSSAFENSFVNLSFGYCLFAIANKADCLPRIKRLKKAGPVDRIAHQSSQDRVQKPSQMGKLLTLCKKSLTEKLTRQYTKLQVAISETAGRYSLPVENAPKRGC